MLEVQTTMTGLTEEKLEECIEEIEKAIGLMLVATADQRIVDAIKILGLMIPKLRKLAALEGSK